MIKFPALAWILLPVIYLQWKTGFLVVFLFILLRGKLISLEKRTNVLY